MLKNGLYSFILLLIISSLSHGQEPCKTSPMQGYSGKCAVSVVQSLDGKHFYTSDQVTLKKWDLKTMKVVEETNDFPYSVHSVTNDPDVLSVNKYNVYSKYDVKQRGDWKAKLLANPAIVIPKKYKAAELEAYDEALNILIVQTKTPSTHSLVKISLGSEGKAVVLATAESKISVLYSPELKWLAAVTTDMAIIDIQSGKELTRIDGYGEMYHFSISPDKKYTALCSMWRAYVFDTATGKHLKTIDDGEGHETFVVWKSNVSGFYFYCIDEDCTHGSNCLRQLTEYSLPDVTLVADRMKGDIKYSSTYEHIILDADKGKLFLNHPQSLPYDFGSFDIATGGRGEKMSLKYEPTAELVKLDTIERRNRIRTFNKTIERLFAMEAPAHRHVMGNSLKPGAATADGTLLIHENEQVFRWKFPEGKCEAVYVAKNSPRNEGIGADPIYVAGAIMNSFITNDGSVVAFNYRSEPVSFEILKGGSVQLKMEAKELYALFDGKALIGDPSNHAFEYNRLELIETTTGKSLFKFPAKVTTTTLDASAVKDKIFFIDDTSIKMFDLKTMATTTHPLLDAKKMGHYFSLRHQFNTAINRSQAYPGLKARKGYGNEREQGRYFLSGNKDEGFDVYDLVEGRYLNAKPLYSGWETFASMHYFPALNQLVVWQSYPSYTRPNATKDEPGASAFAIDIKTGDITPYLMHLDRQTIIATAPPVVPFVYTPISDCDYAELVLPIGAIWKLNGNDVVKIGFDCESSEHVLIVRQRDPQNHSLFSVRFDRQKYVHKEGGFHYNGGSARYQLCPACGGFPLQTGEVNYTGWTDWEQQNFNIYSRRYVKNKKITQTQVCTTCRGQAILPVK